MSIKTNEERSALILERLRSKKSTNINNINNTNNINNLTTKIIVGKTNNEEEAVSPSASLGLASLPARPLALPNEIHFESGSKLPPAWMNCKWDMFSNSGLLKLKCNIIKQDSGQMPLTANLNSPHDRVWRKVADKNVSHWKTVKQQYDLWRSIFGVTVNDFRVSKFYLAGKKGSVEVVCFMVETQTDYCIRMIYRGMLYDYAIPKASIENLSIKQIKGNQIATLFVGKRPSGFVSLDELGI